MEDILRLSGLKSKDFSDFIPPYQLIMFALMRNLTGSFIVSTILLPLCGLAGLFSIDIAFDTGMDDGYKSAFNDAVTFWESKVTGYRISGLSGISINASVAYIDGPYGILGSAGPNNVAYGNVVLDGDSASSYICYSTSGSMTFDSADVDMMISDGTWGQVIRHEMAHVIGFGTLWGLDLFGTGTIYNDFYDAGSGKYTGAAGLAAYQAEFDPDAAFVPVELGGGTGTSDGHWDEIDNGVALTGITDAAGNDMAFELMTGWLNSPTFLSQTTLGQFYDLGYTVIPEPSTITMMASFTAIAFWVRRRYSYMA